MQANVRLLASLGILALVCYLPFLSSGLDDFDSFSFALALDRYDLYLQQPHPPGFPLYIVLANGVRWLVGDGQRALVLLSAFGGAVGVVATAWIGLALFGRRVGVLAGVLLAFTPVYWLNSLLALSDVLGLALVLLACALWVSARAWTPHGKQALWRVGMGAFVAGLSLGVRPHNALPLLWVALWMAGWARASVWRVLGIALVAGALACLLWAVPMFITVGGLEVYWDAIRSHSQHVVSNDSFLAGTTPLDARLGAFVAGLVGLFAESPTHALAVLLAGVLATVGILRGGARWGVGLLVVWLISVSGKLFVLESLERTRLYLPLLPPLWLLLAYGVAKAMRGRVWARVAGAGLLLLACGLAWQAFPFVQQLPVTPSAPEQATAYVRQHYAPEETLVIMFGSHRATQYALNDYPQMYVFFYEREFWYRDIAYRQVPYIAMFDRDNIWDEAYETIISTQNYVPIEDITFKRDARVFPQHSEVRLQILAPLANVTPAQLALAEDGVLATAAERDGKHFGVGWYRVEDIGGVMARWAGQDARLQVSLARQDWHMTFTATPYSTGQTVAVWVNGQEVAVVALEGVWQSYVVRVPAETITADVTLIELRHARADVPPADVRPLATAYTGFTFAGR